MAGERKSQGGWGRWVMWLILGEFVTILILTPILGQEGLRWLTRQEREWSLSELGFETTLWVEKTGFAAYATLFRDTGVEQHVYEFFLPSVAQVEGSKGLEALGANLYFPMVKAGLDSLFASFQRFSVRLMAIVLWLPIVPLVLVPALLDGMMSWRRKQFSFDYASPLVHGYAASTAKWVLFGLPLALLLPFPIPPILAPFIFIAFSFLLMNVASHTQKRV